MATKWTVLAQLQPVCLLNSWVISITKSYRLPVGHTLPAVPWMIYMELLVVKSVPAEEVKSNQHLKSYLGMEMSSISPHLALACPFFSRRRVPKLGTEYSCLYFQAKGIKFIGASWCLQWNGCFCIYTSRAKSPPLHGENHSKIEHFMKKRVGSLLLSFVWIWNTF